MVWALNIETPYMYDIGAEPLDGDFLKVDVVDRTPDGGVLPSGLLSGRPVRTDHVPTKMRWGNSKYKIPDFDACRCINVSVRARAMIENFEPNIHQFIPVDYVNKSGNLLEKRYFFIPCNRIDSMDRTKTTMVFITTKHGDYWRPVYDLVVTNKQALIPPHLPHDTKSKWVFDRKKIGGKHVWIDKHILGGMVPWISDELAEALKASDLTGLEWPVHGMETN